MASLNELKAVHMPSEEQREFRSLVKYRKTLDYRICKMKKHLCLVRKPWHHYRHRRESMEHWTYADQLVSQAAIGL
ncbi:MAG: hypothetical protein R3C53_17965 [Pirellulaceae bacterium]